MGLAAVFLKALVGTAVPNDMFPGAGHTGSIHWEIPQIMRIFHFLEGCVWYLPKYG